MIARRRWGPCLALALCSVGCGRTESSRAVGGGGAAGSDAGGGAGTVAEAGADAGGCGGFGGFGDVVGPHGLRRLDTPIFPSMAAQNSASVLVSGAQAGGNDVALYVMEKESGLATCLMPYPHPSSGLALDDTHVYVGAHVPQGEGPTSNGWIDAIPLAGGATTTLVQLPSMHASSLLVASGFVWFLGSGHLWRVPSAGGIAEDLGPVSGAPFAATDTRIFANDDGAVYAFDIATSTWEKVATIAGGAQRVRHRDGWIYWSTYPTATMPSKLYRVPDTGGVPTPLIDLTNVGFDVVGNAVFYFQATTCPENIVHRYDVGTGSDLEWFTAPCYASVLADSTAPRLFAVSSWDSDTPGTLSRVDAN